MAIQAAIPYIIAALSAGAQAYNTKRTADRQDEVALAGLDRQRAKQREADARLNAELAELEKSSPEDERAQSLEQFMNALRTSKMQRAGGGDVPGASERYAQDAATSRAGIQNYGDKLSGILSRIRGGIDQRRNESIGFNRAGSDVDAIAREARGDDFINRLRMSSITRNPWIDAAGEFGMGVSSGMAGSGAGDDQWMYDAMSRTGTEKIPSMIPRGATASSASGRLPVFGSRVT
jgi:hypothetical protein